MEFGVKGVVSFTAAYLEKKVVVCLLIDGCWLGCI